MVKIAPNCCKNLPRCWAVPVDTSGWADMISRHGVSQIKQNVGIVDRFNFGQLDGHAIEERRVLDVSRVLIPRIKGT